MMVHTNRSLESSVFNKANELQEDISMKRFDLRVAQVHLSAVRSQVGHTNSLSDILGPCEAAQGCIRLNARPKKINTIIILVEESIGVGGGRRR